MTQAPVGIFTAATGDVNAVPSRLNLIYRTNMRTAYAAGQWQRIQRTKRGFPYLLYGLGPSAVHRDQHVAWAGTILPVDDPWWDTHFPPNGWGCKCHVRSVGSAERKRLMSGEDKLPRGTQRISTERPPDIQRDWVNRRTGEVHTVPEGIDPSWDWNAGKHRDLGMRRAWGDHITKILGTPKQFESRVRRKAAVDYLPDGFRASLGREQIAEDLVSPAVARWWDKTPALSDSERRRYMKSQGAVTIPTAVFTADVWSAMRGLGEKSHLKLSRDGIAHIKYQRAYVRPKNLLLVQKAVDTKRIYELKPRGGVDRFIAFAYDDDGKLWAVVWKLTKNRKTAFQTTMRRSNEKDMRRIINQPGVVLLDIK